MFDKGKYIDVETVRVIAHDYLCVQQDEDAFMAEIDRASVSDVAPVKCGKWIERHDFPILVCSCCGNGTLRSHSAIRIYENHGTTENTKSAPYCPNCGAKMDADA